MSYLTVVKSEIKFCHRYPVEHNEYLFIEAEESALKPSGPAFEFKNYINLYNSLSEQFSKKPTILIIRQAPKVRWWQFWRWF